MSILVGEARDRRGFEQRAQWQLDLERLADARDHLRREQRMPSELEEVIVDADAIDAQQARPDSAARRSVRVRGATYTVSDVCSGTGSALRSILPFGDSGSVASTTTADGTMYSGNRSLT